MYQESLISSERGPFSMTLSQSTNQCSIVIINLWNDYTGIPVIFKHFFGPGLV